MFELWAGVAACGRLWMPVRESPAGGGSEGAFLGPTPASGGRASLGTVLPWSRSSFGLRRRLRGPGAVVGSEVGAAPASEMQEGRRRQVQDWQASVTRKLIWRRAGFS